MVTYSIKLTLLTYNINLKLYEVLTLYINIDINCFRCPCRIAGCTTVRSWHFPLYIWNCKFGSIVKYSTGIVRFVPCPRDSRIRVGGGHSTLQRNGMPLNNSVWTWGSWCHFWFIYNWYDFINRYFSSFVTKTAYALYLKRNV